MGSKFSSSRRSNRTRAASYPELERFTKSTGLYDEKLFKWKGAEDEMKDLIMNGLMAPRICGIAEDCGDSSTIQECSLCYNNYDKALGLNTATCCNVLICTECYLHIQDSKYGKPCPFCTKPNFKLSYTYPHSCIESQRRKMTHDLRGDARTCGESGDTVSEDDRRGSIQSISSTNTEVTSPTRVHKPRSIWNRSKSLRRLSFLPQDKESNKKEGRHSTTKSLCLDSMSSTTQRSLAGSSRPSLSLDLTKGIMEQPSNHTHLATSNKHIHSHSYQQTMWEKLQHQRKISEIDEEMLRIKAMEYSRKNSHPWEVGNVGGNQLLWYPESSIMDEESNTDDSPLEQTESTLSTCSAEELTSTLSITNDNGDDETGQTSGVSSTEIPYSPSITTRLLRNGINTDMEQNNAQDKSIALRSDNYSPASSPRHNHPKSSLSTDISPYDALTIAILHDTQDKPTSNEIRRYSHQGSILDPDHRINVLGRTISDGYMSTGTTSTGDITENDAKNRQVSDDTQTSDTSKSPSQHTLDSQTVGICTTQAENHSPTHLDEHISPTSSISPQYSVHTVSFSPHLGRQASPCWSDMDSQADDTNPDYDNDLPFSPTGQPKTKYHSSMGVREGTSDWDTYILSDFLRAVVLDHELNDTVELD